MSRNTLTVAQLRTILTEDQIKAAEMRVEDEFRDKKDRIGWTGIAKELGYNRRTLYQWRQKPEFQQYVAYLSNVERDSFYPTVIKQLHRAIEGGNNGEPSIRAIELWLKATGKLVDTQYVVTEERTTAPLTRKDVSEGLQELDDIINHRD